MEAWCIYFFARLKTAGAGTILSRKPTVEKGWVFLRNLDGTYTASFDLSSSIKENGLNNSELMSYPAIYKVKEGDTVHSIALEND